MKKKSPPNKTRPKKGQKPQANARQDLFVKEYLTNGFNASRAALAAGYSERSAPRIAQRLLSTPHVVALVDREKKEIAERYGVTAEKVIKEMATIGFANMQDYTTVQNNGLAVVDLSNVNREQAGAIKKIKSRTLIDHYEENKDGDRVPVYATENEVELHDKITALTHLGKYTKVFSADSDSHRPVRVQVVYEDGEKRAGISIDVGEAS